MYKKSKYLTESENRQLEILSSLACVAPLSKPKYDEYVALCKKAHRKPTAECV